jgi:hypothetical protein
VPCRVTMIGFSQSCRSMSRDMIFHFFRVNTPLATKKINLKTYKKGSTQVKSQTGGEHSLTPTNAKYFGIGYREQETVKSASCISNILDTGCKCKKVVSFSKKVSQLRFKYIYRWSAVPCKIFNI